ncbi:MAG: phosphate acyltransferase PlsX, partial [Spongiibacteraceae bacterium]
MPPTVRVAIDVMSGDHGLRVSLPAAIAALEACPDLHLVLVGDAALISAAIPAAISGVKNRERITVVGATQIVAMDDKPAHAIRHKTDSSMRIALDTLERGEVDAVVSAGNTGALMAMSVVVLNTLEGIDRPAFCAPVPTQNGHCFLLDLGANVDCSAAQLQQFAWMGAALSAALDGIAKPRVALLNIGAEAIKGNEQVKSAANLLAADPQINYVGYVEGDGIFAGAADVVVCDGFVGNVALKVCEGTARLVRDKIRSAFARSALSRLLGIVAQPALNQLRDELDPQRYNGAALLGLQGIVVKSHGNSTVLSFEQAIGVAV